MKWKDMPIKVVKAKEKFIPFKASTADVITGTFVIPILLANGIFILLGLLFASLVLPQYTIMYWCALLIAGSAGLAVSIFVCTYSTENPDPEDKSAVYKGALIGVLIVNGFVYGGEIVWFLIVSLQLGGAVAIVILIQFIGQYIPAVLFSQGVFFIEHHWSEKKKLKKTYVVT